MIFDNIYVYISYVLLKNNKTSFMAAQFITRKLKHELMKVGNGPYLSYSKAVKFIESKLIKEKSPIITNMLIAMLSESEGCIKMYFVEILGKIGDDRAIVPILKAFFIDRDSSGIGDIFTFLNSLREFKGHPDVLGFADGIVNYDGKEKEKIMFHATRISEIYHFPEFKDCIYKALETAKP